MREFHEVEITCDGPGCESVTYHSGWADNLRAAFTRARVELVRNHGWGRLTSPLGPPLDLCPACLAAQTTNRNTETKELAHAC